MFIKIYQKYIIKEFLSTALKIFSIFFILAFIIGIFEELSFFSEFDVDFYFPIFLVFLNIPTILYELFPFIFLITTQFFFIKLVERDEIIAFKNFGLTNIKILSIISFTSLIMGVLIVVFFYNISAVLKFKYLDFKNEFTHDNKYLATITENGIWIKDQTDNNVSFINAETISVNFLYNVDILKFNKNFELQETIFSKKVDITSNTWKMDLAQIIYEDNKSKEKKDFEYNSNFNFTKIHSLFSNLSALTVWELFKIKKDYELINYSTTEVSSHLQKLLAYPFYLAIMTILSATIMMNIKHQKPKIFYIVSGILFSVIIYYIQFFFSVLGKSERIPINLSIWLPIILLLIISLIGIIRLNEK
jgi:lipopolysaccharide export system permease protein